jgi:Mg/Co/Ni transporter MgtE
MAKTNPVLKQEIIEVVNNQLENLDPPETKETYDRLVADGISDQEARRLIGCVVSSEIFDVLKQEQPFDHARFVTALNKLPKLPWE